MKCENWGNLETIVLYLECFVPVRKINTCDLYCKCNLQGLYLFKRYIRLWTQSRLDTCTSRVTLQVEKIHFLCKWLLEFNVLFETWMSYSICVDVYIVSIIIERAKKKKYFKLDLKYKLFRHSELSMRVIIYCIVDI